MNFKMMLLCICLFGLNGNAQKIDVTKVPVISVTGTAEINVIPDSAVFTMYVEKINKDILAAKTENDESVSKIMAIAKKHKIADKDSKTDFISVSKRYEFVGTGSNRRRVFLGYAVSKTVIVKLKDLKIFEQFFSDMLGTGVTAVRSVYFQTSEFQKHKRDMRLKAIRAAKVKASEMTMAIGQRIGKAIMITEDAGRRFPTANITANYVGTAPSVAGSNAKVFSPGTITIRSQVEVKFSLD
jgi:uncharacterized protein YggE